MTTEFFSLTPDEQAARMQALGAAVLDQWGMAGAEMRLLKYRENAVFEVQQNGLRRALRMHRVGYHSDAELRSELQWMMALAEFGIHVPQLVPTVDGELFIAREGDGLPGAVQIDLFEWIDGRQLGSVEEGLSDAAGATATFSTIGELAAQVHNQASAWALPEGFVRHAWDAEGLAGEQPFWGRFWEVEIASPAQTEALLEARDTVYSGLRNLPKTPDTYSMIHADFAPENLILEGDEVRLIDFDDAGFGWHLFEIVTSLYFLRGEAVFEDAQAALIDGYRRHRALSDEQLELLPLFYLARGLTYVGWIHTRSETETAIEMGSALLDMAMSALDDYRAAAS